MWSSMFYYLGDNSAFFPSGKRGIEPHWADKIGVKNPIARVTLTQGLHRFPISKSGIAFHYWSCLIALIQTLPPIPLFFYLKSLQQTNETITHNKQQRGLSSSLPMTAVQTCSQNTYFWGKHKQSLSWFPITCQGRGDCTLHNQEFYTQAGKVCPESRRGIWNQSAQPFC